MRKMINGLSHRGPDAQGIYHKDGIGLGHTRLSVIDLSPSANQPLSNEDATIWLISNGEIYNYKDLTQLLISKGHRFRTNSDAEVIIHAYEAYGEDCVKKFNGAFAFCIWDERKQKLFSARDRLGIRPLYYARMGGALLFSSELRAILQYSQIDNEVNYSALDEYLAFRYIAYETMFKNIFQLPPAHTLSYHQRRLKITRYWNIEMRRSDNRPEAEYAGQFLQLLKDSVTRRMASDVPVGVFLSGGVDSSAIVGLLSEIGKLPLKSFSIGFDGSNDEGGDAGRISRYFGTEHHHIESRPEDIELLPKIVSYLDGPIGDGIIIPMFILSRFSRRYVKVILTGEGADELLGGYIHQKAMNLMQLYRRIVPDFVTAKLVTPFLRHMPERALDVFFDYPAFIGRAGKQRLISFLSCVDNFNESYLAMASLFSEEDKRNLLNPDLYQQIKRFRNKQDSRHITGNSNGHTFFEQAILYDMQYWLPGYTLFKQDRIFMANSIEGRVPFLDHHLVEFAMRLPSHLRIKRMTDKYILRKSAQSLLSRGVAYRKKYPFFVAVDKVYRDGFREMLGDFLSEESVKKRKFFNYTYIKHLTDNLDESSLLYSKQLMSLLILEIWQRIFIDREIEIS